MPGEVQVGLLSPLRSNVFTQAAKEVDDRMKRHYYWTKKWGAPDIPKYDAIALSHEKTRERILEFIQPGDIVIYLTSDGKERIQCYVVALQEPSRSPVPLKEWT